MSLSSLIEVSVVWSENRTEKRGRIKGVAPLTGNNHSTGEKNDKNSGKNYVRYSNFCCLDVLYIRAVGKSSQAKHENQPYDQDPATPEERR
jgi:hypothetical protein